MHIPISFILMLWYGFVVTIPPGYRAEPRSLEFQGMEVDWELKGQHIHFEASSPTQGWIAIGINSQNRLAGTHLIMLCVDDEGVSCEEFLVLAPGDYRPMKQLGLPPVVEKTSGEETATGTSVKFKLPLEAPGPYRHSLKDHADMYLLMAYAREDDFSHHSIVRTMKAFKP